MKINLISDTVTNPTKEMLEVMMNASVGDDVFKEDPSGNIRPDKGRSQDKIDGICATLMGMALASHYGSDSRVYNTCGSGVMLF